MVSFARGIFLGGFPEKMPGQSKITAKPQNPTISKKCSVYLLLERGSKDAKRRLQITT